MSVSLVGTGGRRPVSEGMASLERSKQVGRGVEKNPGHPTNVVYVARQLSPGPDHPLENILRRSQVCSGFWRRECGWLWVKRGGGWRFLLIEKFLQTSHQHTLN